MAGSHDKHIEMGSERGFGLVFAVVFALIALWPLVRGNDVRLWALVVAALFAVVAFAVPALLKWPNRLWFKFGLLLGKDLLGLRRKNDDATYWHQVDPAARSPMKNQF